MEVGYDLKKVKLALANIVKTQHSINFTANMNLPDIGPKVFQNKSVPLCPTPPILN